MRRLLWTVKALREFSEAIEFIATGRPLAAQSVAERIDAAAQALAQMPTGRRGRVTGTYEKVVTGLPYVLAYDLDVPPGTLRILHLIHGARDWPDGSWPE